MMKKILIADDDRNVRESLKDLLSAKGYKVIQAATAEEALEKTHETKPDLILLDTRMPS
ncbi:MAG: response regulator, partial [Candidatus Omnitrophica bacterium]|nr:response regulator [Candidatus Omnitrophota bacterium]